jgi:hypothetical protein
MKTEEKLMSRRCAYKLEKVSHDDGKKPLMPAPCWISGIDLAVLDQKPDPDPGAWTLIKINK